MAGINLKSTKVPPHDRTNDRAIIERLLASLQSQYLKLANRIHLGIRARSTRSTNVARPRCARIRRGLCGSWTSQPEMMKNGHGSAMRLIEKCAEMPLPLSNRGRYGKRLSF